MRPAELRATIAVIKHRIEASQTGLHHRGAILVSNEMAREILKELEALFALTDPNQPAMPKGGPM